MGGSELLTNFLKEPVVMHFHYGEWSESYHDDFLGDTPKEVKPTTRRQRVRALQYARLAAGRYGDAEPRGRGDEGPGDPCGNAR